jgi:hypothetical protein
LETAECQRICKLDAIADSNGTALCRSELPGGVSAEAIAQRHDLECGQAIRNDGA